jgi:hypothetical protein
MIKQDGPSMCPVHLMNLLLTRMVVVYEVMTSRSYVSEPTEVSGGKRIVVVDLFHRVTGHSLVLESLLKRLISFF